MNSSDIVQAADLKTNNIQSMDYRHWVEVGPEVGAMTSCDKVPWRRFICFQFQILSERNQQHEQRTQMSIFLGYLQNYNDNIKTCIKRIQLSFSPDSTWCTMTSKSNRNSDIDALSCCV